MFSSALKMTLFRELKQVIFRFPMPVLCCVIATTLEVIHEFSYQIFDVIFLENLMAGLTAAFLASGICNLYLGATKRLQNIQGQFFCLLIALLIGGLVYYGDWTMVNRLFLFSGLSLLLMVAPYLFQSASEENAWLYTLRLTLAAVLGFIAGLVFFAGLAGIASSINFLFDIKVTSYIYTTIADIAIFFIGPVFGLALMPVRFDEAFKLPAPDTLISRGVHVLLNYILTPILVIYLIMLHLYAAKMIVTWSLPKGQIGLMVLSFTICLTGAVLVTRPWHPRCTRLTKWFLRYWHLLLITPFLLLAISATRRVADYGLTPERYGLVLAGFWIALLFAVPVFKRHQLRNTHIITILALLLLGTSTGPWGATSLSIRSQTTQFYNLLERKEWLKDDKILVNFPDKGSLSDEEANTGATIIEFLDRYNALENIKPVFKGHPKDPFKSVENNVNKARLIKTFFDFKRHPYVQKQDHVYYRSREAGNITIKDASTLIGPFKLTDASNSPVTGTRDDRAQAWINNNKLFIKTSQYTSTIQVEDLLKAAKAQEASLKENPIIHVQGIPGGKLKLIISKIYLETENGKLKRVNTLDFWAVITRP